MRFFIHWLITIAGLVVAYFVLAPQGWMSIKGPNAILAFAVMAVIIGLANILIRPILQVLSCAFIVVTLGLFMLVINAFILWLSSWVSQQINIGLSVQWPQGVIFGSIIISVVSFIIHLFVHERKIA